MGYKSWKDALNREIDGLDLNVNQIMDLLLMRTTGIAKEFVQHSRDLYLQDEPEQALQNTRTALDKRFVTRQKPSQKLLHSLLQGPTIERKSINVLFLFAHDCNMAAKQQDSIRRS